MNRNAAAKFQEGNKMQSRIEELLKSQARIREMYRAGEIDAAISEYDSTVASGLGAVDPRISRCARRLSTSFIQMVDDDLAEYGPCKN
jgi:hypothetical protein